MDLKSEGLINLQVRAVGAVGCVLITSFLIRENILALVSTLLFSPTSHFVT